MMMDVDKNDQLFELKTNFLYMILIYDDGLRT